MEYPNVIVSNQKEESISIQRANLLVSSDDNLCKQFGPTSPFPVIGMVRMGNTPNCSKDRILIRLHFGLEIRIRIRIIFFVITNA